MTEFNLSGLKMVFAGLLLLVFSKIINWLPDFIFYCVIFYGLFELSISYPEIFDVPKQGSVMVLALEMCQYLSYKFLPSAFMLLLVLILKWVAIMYMMCSMVDALCSISLKCNNQTYINKVKKYKYIFSFLCLVCIACNGIIFITPLQMAGYIGLISYICFWTTAIFFALHIQNGYTYFNKETTKSN